MSCGRYLLDTTTKEGEGVLICEEFDLGSASITFLIRNNRAICVPREFARYGANFLQTSSAHEQC
jgi:hypothetical protein